METLMAGRMTGELSEIRAWDYPEMKENRLQYASLTEASAVNASCM
jgi:hypothetical protein